MISSLDKVSLDFLRSAWNLRNIFTFFFLLEIGIGLRDNGVGALAGLLCLATLLLSLGNERGRKLENESFQIQSDFAEFARKGLQRPR